MMFKRLNTYFTTKILQLDLEGPSKRQILDANGHCFKDSIDPSNWSKLILKIDQNRKNQKKIELNPLNIGKGRTHLSLKMRITIVVNVTAEDNTKQ